MHYSANDAWEKSFLEIYTRGNAMRAMYRRRQGQTAMV